MAFLIVTIQEARDWLKLDDGEPDAVISRALSAASRAVVRYLKWQAGSILIIDSPPNSPPDNLANVVDDVAMAVLILAGILLKERDGDPDGMFFDVGQLPKPVTALLYPMRDPTLA